MYTQASYFIPQKTNSYSCWLRGGGLSTCEDYARLVFDLPLEGDVWAPSLSLGWPFFGRGSQRGAFGMALQGNLRRKPGTCPRSHPQVFDETWQYNPSQGSPKVAPGKVGGPGAQDPLETENFGLCNSQDFAGCHPKGMQSFACQARVRKLALPTRCHMDVSYSPRGFEPRRCLRGQEPLRATAEPAQGPGGQERRGSVNFGQFWVCLL